MRLHILTAIIAVFAACVLVSPAQSFAQDGVGAPEAQQINNVQRLSLAREFLARMKRGFASVQQDAAPVQAQGAQTNILPEGEVLLFQAFLSRRLELDGLITGRIQNGEILLSFKDFIEVLELPIAFNAEASIAEGWYIREHKNFKMDMAAGSVETDRGSFQLPLNISAEDGDILLPLKELGPWFDMEISLDVSSLEIVINSAQPLPVQEFLERRKRDLSKRKKQPPVLPRGGEDYQIADVPFVDILTNSRYDRQGSSGSQGNTQRHDVNIRTVGDLAYGTFTTQTQYNNEDKITNIRTNYKQESLEPDLLGPLNAKHFEVGDVVTTRLPLGGGVGQELGARISNVDPLRTFTNPTTAISGTTFPGWDVELYRENQIVGFQTVGDDGFYIFNNVNLFNRDNNFRVVFYGPQGEVREEDVFVPVDRGRLSEVGSVYDVSLTFEGKQSFRKDTGFKDEDEGSPNLVALYEQPIMDGTAVSAGFSSSQQEGVRNNVLHTGASTTIFETLINANAAIDDEGEAAAEFVARRDFGAHELSNKISWEAENFDSGGGALQNSVGDFQENFNAVGPLPIGIGNRPRYSLNLNYMKNTNGVSSLASTTGFNTAWRNFNFNEQVSYFTNSNVQDDQISSLTSLTGTFGRNRLRVLSDYAVQPDSNLRRVVATYERDFTTDIDIDLEVERRIDPALTEASAQLNWQAGFVRISPSVRYNSENDFFAGLSTRFGLAYDRQSGRVKSFDKTLTANGGLSAFVFLDENGDGEFNPNEEPLEGVIVRALQNGGQVKTDENGIALFTGLRELQLTDVVVDEEALEGPFWISGFEGVSILPREGYVAQVQFPIHIAGELDGTLYARKTDGSSFALRNIPIHLYSDKGEAEQSAMTDITGFYLFTRVPPGRYLLLVGEKASRDGKFARPGPQPIEIGYDGTVIYGNDIFVEAGPQDIPSAIKANLEDYKAAHPHVDFSQADYDLVLNLGEYNSKLLMTLVWYRLQSRYKAVLAGAELMVSPGESIADSRTGKYTLRAGLRNQNVDGAYHRCRALAARNLPCKVEIFPAFMVQQVSSRN